MSADRPPHDDTQLFARLHAAFEDDADDSRLVDVDQLWSRVRKDVPARRRRRSAQRASLAAGLAVLVVAGAAGGLLAVRVVDGRPPSPPAISTAVPATQALLPPPQRTPRVTSTSSAQWVLPEQCVVPAPESAEMVTARDGQGTYGALIDVTQVVRFADRTTAATALRELDGALEDCAADSPDLSVTALGDGLTGVQVQGSGDTSTTTVVVLAQDAVALLTTSGPSGPVATTDAQVLTRALTFTQLATPADTTGGRP